MLTGRDELSKKYLQVRLQKSCDIMQKNPNKPKPKKNHSHFNMMQGTHTDRNYARSNTEFREDLNSLRRIIMVTGREHEKKKKQEEEEKNYPDI